MGAGAPRCSCLSTAAADPFPAAAVTESNEGVEGAPARFLTIGDVAAELNVTHAQVYALLRAGNLEGIRLGGRNQWRVERARLEAWIDRAHADTAAHVRAQPPGSVDPPDEDRGGC